MRYLIAIVGLLVVIGGLAATKYAQISKLIGFGETMKAAGPPPETVSSGRVQKQQWDDGIEAVASVVAAKGVTLSNDTPGLVSRILFDSGASVRAGQVLVELDTSVERAQLASLRARVRLAETSLARTKVLVEGGSLARAQLDSDEANYQGLVADERAVVAQIARKTVRAPFAGKLGIRAVNLGQYLAPGTPITVLESEKAIYVDFTVPQARVRELKLDTPVVAFVEGKSGSAAKGTVTAIEPNVDASSRNARVRASIQDPAEELQPGMFLRIRVVKPELRDVVTVPATAVLRASYGDSVFCVEEEPKAAGTVDQPRKTARQKFVKLGETRGDYVAVLDGVTAGEEVVTAGAFKLRNGIPVVVNNAVALDFRLSPTPANR
jgi:membrane fusion protein (multidrug efflux system)